MSAQKPFTFNASDVLGALSLEAQRIVAATAKYAAGEPFPDPHRIGATLDRMKELNAILIDFVDGQKQVTSGEVPVN